MTTHLATFSDQSMSRSRELCAESAKQHGVARAYQAVPAQDDARGLQRGWGFWQWKPRIIYGLMTSEDVFFKRPEDGDILIYADAGIEFINNVNYIIDRMDQDIFLFGNNWEHAHWCKRDVVEAIWPDYRMGTVRTEDDYSYRVAQMWSRFGKQVQASVIFFRVSDYTRQFVREWLDWCLREGGRLIDDSPSRTPNHPEFRENRHDQAILTTMAYREGIKLHWWPASYNDGAFSYEKLPEYASDDYPVLFHHHRKRNHEWEEVA